MSLSKEEILDAIAEMSVMDVVALVEAMEEKFGVSAAAAAISNVGPGLGSIVGPEGNYANLPTAAKWILSMGMLLGRLELFTVMVLFTRSFWRA